MATLSSSKGRHSVQFPKVGAPGRFTVRLGKMSRKSAETIRSHVDHVVAEAD